MNSGLLAGGEDLGAHFSKYGLDHLALMARRDQAGINACDDDTIGCLRQCVFFNPSREQIGFQAQVVQGVSVSTYEEEKARRQQYYDTL